MNRLSVTEEPAALSSWPLTGVDDAEGLPLRASFLTFTSL